MPTQRKPVVMDLSAQQRSAVLARIERRASGDFFGCWEWDGQHSKDGYATMLVKATDGKWKPAKVHRVTYTLVFGQPELGRHLHHVCHNRGCVNPTHVRPTTPAEHGVEHRHSECPKGHPLEGDNLLPALDGHRRCRTCANERTKLWNRDRKTFHRGDHKTECKHGHPWVPENIYVKPSTGHKECRVCHRERNRKPTS